MGRAAAIQAKIDAVLNRVGPPDRLAYKRIVTTTGGDTLIGRPGSVTHVDTLCSPQPSYATAISSRKRVEHEYLIITPTGKAIEAQDLKVLFSGSAITRDELANPSLQIVLKDANGDVEVFAVYAFEPTFIEGRDLAFDVILRSVSRT